MKTALQKTKIALQKTEPAMQKTETALHKGQEGGRLVMSDGARRRVAGDGGGRWPASAKGGDWLDVDMWHSMLALERAALCVILIFL
ncbi:unnamed protein product [Prunus armeniaca]